jgi:hypothetical protein
VQFVSFLQPVLETHTFADHDYAVGASVTVRDQAGNTGTTMVQFAIRDVPEIADPGNFTPPEENDAAWSLDLDLEDSPAGQVQWSIGNADGDGEQGSLFDIDPDTGVLTLREALDVEDPEGMPAYSVTAVATANGVSGRYTVRLSPEDVPLLIDGPYDTISVEEGAESRRVHDFNLSNNGDLAFGTLHWEIVPSADDDSSRFSVDANGVVTFALEDSTFDSHDDHDNDGTYTATLRVSDDAGQVASRIVNVGLIGAPDLTINPADENININDLRVVENTPDAVVMQAVLSSTGQLGNVTWSLADGLDQDQFSIANDGTLTLLEQDYEAVQKAFSVEVIGNDGLGHTVQQRITVNIENAPLEINTSQTTYHVDEGTSLPIAVTLDPSQGDIDWTTTGNDADDFHLDFSNGAITLVFGGQNFAVPADHDLDNEYSVTLVANGNQTLTASRTITVIVDNVDETSGAAELAGAAEWFSGPPVDLDPFHVAPPPTFG